MNDEEYAASRDAFFKENPRLEPFRLEITDLVEKYGIPAQAIKLSAVQRMLRLYAESLIPSIEDSDA
jgi:hypothetical protein